MKTPSVRGGSRFHGMIAVAEGARVAILAVDPSSHITGGAVLGDRVRMTNNVGDDIFIRSFAARGVVGGIARVVPGAHGREAEVHSQAVVK